MKTRNRRDGGTVTLVILAVLATGCASDYAALRSETDQPRLTSLLEAAAEVPYQEYWVDVEVAGGKVVRMYFRERGYGDRHVIALGHGLMTNSQTWRYLEGVLGSEFDIWAWDLVGYGQSDKPDPEDLGPRGHSPDAHARRVLTALRARLAERGGDTRITYVAQSYGGMVALRLFGSEQLKEEFADVFDRIDRVLLIAPGDFAIEKAYPVFKMVANLEAWEVFVGDVTGIIRAKCATFIRYSTYEEERTATREGADGFAEALLDGDLRATTQAIITQAVPFIEMERPDWDEIDKLTCDYANIDKPMMIVWGSRDTTFPLSMGYKLQREIPGAKLTIIEKTMHTVQQERPRICGSVIREFIAGSGRDAPEVRRIDPYEAMEVAAR